MARRACFPCLLLRVLIQTATLGLMESFAKVPEVQARSTLLMYVQPCACEGRRMDAWIKKDVI